MKKTVEKHTQTNSGWQGLKRRLSIVQSLFTWMKKVITTVAHWMNGMRIRVTGLQMWENIDEMPLNSFIGILVDTQYHLLYKVAKKGVRFAESEEMARWYDLYAEYGERLMGNDTSSMKSAKKIVQLTAKVRVLAAFSMLIHDGRMQNMKNVARFYGVRITGDGEKDMAMVNAEFQSALRELKKSLENNKNEDGCNEYTREYFTQILVNMSSHFKFPITMDISVGAYCAYYNQMKRDIKAMEKLNKKEYGR